MTTIRCSSVTTLRGTPIVHDDQCHGVLGLRYVVCNHCETVFALPEREERCGRCGSEPLEDITAELLDDAYFVPLSDPDC